MYWVSYIVYWMSERMAAIKCECARSLLNPMTDLITDFLESTSKSSRKICAKMLFPFFLCCCFYMHKYDANHGIAQRIVITRVGWAILRWQIQFSRLLFFISFNDLIFCVCILRLKSIITNRMALFCFFLYSRRYKTTSSRLPCTNKITNFITIQSKCSLREKCATFFFRPKEIENNYLSSQLRCMMAHILQDAFAHSCHAVNTKNFCTLKSWSHLINIFLLFFGFSIKKKHDIRNNEN